MCLISFQAESSPLRPPTPSLENYDSRSSADITPPSPPKRQRRAVADRIHNDDDENVNVFNAAKRNDTADVSPPKKRCGDAPSSRDQSNLNNEVVRKMVDRQQRELRAVRREQQKTPQKQDQQQDVVQPELQQKRDEAAEALANMLQPLALKQVAAQALQLLPATSAGHHEQNRDNQVALQVQLRLLIVYTDSYMFTCYNIALFHYSIISS